MGGAVECGHGSPAWQLTRARPAQLRPRLGCCPVGVQRHRDRRWLCGAAALFAFCSGSVLVETGIGWSANQGAPPASFQRVSAPAWLLQLEVGVLLSEPADRVQAQKAHDNPGPSGLVCEEAACAAA